MSNSQITHIPIIVNGDMSAVGGVSSGAVNIEFTDNLALHWNWTAGATGTFTVQVSLNPTLLGWVTLPISGILQPAGSSGSNFVDVNQTGAAYLQLVYTRTSGSGTMQGYLCAKAV